MTRNSLCLGLLTLINFGCGTTALNSEGKKVKIVETEPTTCHLIGELSNSDIWAGDRQGTLNRTLNESAEHGADSLFIEQFKGGGGGQVHLKAKMFKCN